MVLVLKQRKGLDKNTENQGKWVNVTVVLLVVNVS